MNAGFDVPARKVSSVASRKGSRTKSPDGHALPLAVVDIAWDSCDSRLVERQAERTTPSGLRYCIAGPCLGCNQENQSEDSDV